MKRRVREWTAAVLLLTMISGSVNLYAADSHKLDAEKNIRVAVLNYPNYIEMDEEGRVSGYAYEYLEEIAQYTGWNYTYVKMDLAGAMQALEDGVIDILPGTQYSAERAQVMDFSERNMGEGGTVICVLPENQNYAFNDFANFAGMKIAALKGSMRQEQVKQRFAEYDVTPNLIEFDTDAASKSALENGAVDAVMMSSIRCEEDLKVVARVNSVDLFFALNKEEPGLKTQIDSAMESIHLDEPYYEAKLDKKYYGNVLEEMSLSSDEIAYVKNAGVIKVAVFEDKNPIEYYDKETGSYEGIMIDAYQLISEYTGLQFQFVPRENRNRLCAQLLKGEVQLIGQLPKDEDIGDYFGAKLTDTTYESTITTIINDSVSDYRETEIRVALHEDYPLYQKIADSLGYQNITFFDSFEKCIQAVDRGKADMTFVPSYCKDRLINHSYYKDLISFTLPDSDCEFCVGVGENTDKELYAVFNKAINYIDQETWSKIIIENVAKNPDVENWRDFFENNSTVILGSGFLVVCLIAVLMGYWLHTRKKANLNLQKMIEEAEYANRAKNDFLSRMSHDMRTPMNAIIGMSALGRDEAENKNSREYFQNIHLSANFLLGLINDVLESSKLDSDSFTLNPSPYSVTEFYNQVESTIVPLCKQKDITFEFHVEEQNEKYVWIDHLRFEQIMFNLLTNAVKFTPCGGKVELEIKSMEKAEAYVVRRFIIRDNGIGMSPQFMQHMYEPFTQERTTLSERTDGSGLGLTIVKKLVELMEGTIQCRNVPGGGTEFTLELKMPVCEEPEEKKKEQLKAIPEYEFGNKKVLLCEDHPLNTQIVVRLLEKQGMQVDCAENGEIGVNLFAKSAVGEYAAILMDIHMPVMDGLSATVAIRNMNREDAKTIPMIAMTANAYEEDKQKSKEAGMNEHLAKPIEPKVLYDTLEKYIK